MFISEQLESVIFILTNVHEDVSNITTPTNRESINTHILQQIETIIYQMNQIQKCIKSK